MRSKLYVFILIISIIALNFSALAQAKPTATRLLNVITEPNTIVWIDDIKRGTTDSTGKLLIKNAPTGIRSRYNRPLNLLLRWMQIASEAGGTKVLLETVLGLSCYNRSFRSIDRFLQASCLLTDEVSQGSVLILN